MPRLLATFTMTVTAAGLLAASAVTAAADFADKDACLQKAFDLAGEAQDKKSSSNALAEIDEMISNLETACEQEKFSEASDIAAKVEKELGN